jgi:hypothetical protein
MTRYILVLWILLLAPNYSSAQSFSIDSSTLKGANEYLIKGAKAREMVSLYRKKHTIDSIYIDTLRVSYKKELSKNAVLLDKNVQLTKWLWITSIFSVILIILS